MDVPGATAEAPPQAATGCNDTSILTQLGWLLQLADPGMLCRVLDWWAALMGLSDTESSEGTGTCPAVTKSLQ